MSEDLKNCFSICGFNNIEENNLFSSGAFSIKSGKQIESY